MGGLRNAGNDSGDGGAGNGVPESLKDRLIVALFAVILGGGGAASYLGINDPRPDPFTGEMGKDLEARLLKRIEAIEQRDDVLRNRVEAHLVRGEAGFWRIEQLEKRMQDLEKHP